MEDQIKKRIALTPSFVQDSIAEEYTIDSIIQIRENFLGDDRDKTEILKNIIGLVILKDIKIEQIKEVLEEALKLKEKESNQVALIILCNILHPIKDFFPGIEDQIVKLGGEVPKPLPKKNNEQLLKREEEMEEMKAEEKKIEVEKMKDTIVNMPVKDLVINYPMVESQVIGSQESIMVKGSDIPMKPIIKFWMKDYLEKMGFYKHSNLERVQYVYHDKNTRKMNEEERRQLGLVLKSLDEEIDLPLSTRTQKIDFGKIE